MLRKPVPLLLRVGIGATFPLGTATRLAQVRAHTCLETAILDLQRQITEMVASSAGLRIAQHSTQ